MAVVNVYVRGPVRSNVPGRWSQAKFEYKINAVDPFSNIIWLPPHSKVGPPTEGYHEAGEIIMDLAQMTWICTASGRPGTWNQIASGGQP